MPNSFKGFFKDIIRKPPIFFPLIGLFHVLWLSWTIWDDRSAPFLGMEWIQVLWMFAYTIFWLAASNLRKWGAIGYLLLTLLDVGLNVGVKRRLISELYLSNMFLLDIIFSLLILYYYKIFSSPPKDS